MLVVSKRYTVVNINHFIYLFFFANYYARKSFMQIWGRPVKGSYFVVAALAFQIIYSDNSPVS